jgi:acyl-CoA-binding protein
MSDSVDRVFSHALNTVNKIRPGSHKPPSSTRLRLYGLYKQAMEGDVEGIMDRPQGGGEEAQRAREKWDAWKQQKGLSRTEAKRRYITTLIDAMHKYAASSPDSRELVSELEFVWDQVKSNVPSSSSSSPMQTMSNLGLHMPPTYSSLDRSRSFTQPGETPDDQHLQIRSPMSQSEEDDMDDQAEEFVDAQDSQYNPHTEPEESQYPHAASLGAQNPFPSPFPDPPAPRTKSPSNDKWRKRVERALVKMTAEIAALREQLEARRFFTASPRETFFRWLVKAVWGSIKHVAIDLVILAIVLLWMRRRKDRRFEGAVRVLLGDAVAQVQRVGGKGIKSIHLPGGSGKKGNG